LRASSPAESCRLRDGEPSFATCQLSARGNNEGEKDIPSAWEPFPFFPSSPRKYTEYRGEHRAHVRLGDYESEGIRESATFSGFCEPALALLRHYYNFSRNYNAFLIESLSFSYRDKREEIIFSRQGRGNPCDYAMIPTLTKISLDVDV